MSPVKSILYEDFSLGIDTSSGVLSRDARKFYELDNYLVNTAQQLERRPPCELLPGQRDGNTQGFIYLNGQFITIAKRGGEPYPFSTDPSLDLLLEDDAELLLEDGTDLLLEGELPTTVTTLLFDNPDFCTSWTLIDLLTFNERVCALIRHTFLGTTVTERVLLHVWDDTRPTWVEDPYVPTNWNKTFPLQAYGAGTLGAVATNYNPVMTVSSDKLFITRPDGNTSFSATNKPRVWNDRTATEILEDGIWWYWIAPTAVNTAASVIISVPYGDLTEAGKYACYVMEFCQSDGTWGQFIEDGGGGFQTYTISSVPNRFDITKPNETQVNYRIPPDTVVRFRALAKPALTVQSGEYLIPAGDILGGTQTVEGAAEQTVTVPGATVLAPLAASTAYFVLTKSARAPAPLVIPYAVARLPTALPLNGQQRYWSRFIALVTSNGAGPPPTAFSFDFTGTLTTTVGSQKVTGVGTLFLTEARVGDIIEFNGERRTVVNIASNLAMEVSVAFTTAATGTGARDVRFRYAYEIGEVGNPWYAAKEAEAALTLAGSGSAGFLNTSLYDNSGGLPVCLAPGQNRLFVQYISSIQMWKTDPTPTNMALLATSEFGSGKNTAPRAALMDGLTALPTFQGPRLFVPDGLSKDYIRMIPIGDNLRTNTLPVFTSAAWWASQRTLVMSGTDDGRLYCFHYHPDSKVMAWSIWTVEGLTHIDRIFAAGLYLYVQSGLLAYRFNPDALVHRDTTDPEGGPAYRSHARWLYNDLGSPARNKHLVRFEIQQQGGCTVSLRVSPVDEVETAPGPPLVSGYTQGLRKVTLAVYSPAIGLEIESTDETGHIVSAIGYDFRLSAR